MKVLHLRTVITEHFVDESQFHASTSRMAQKEKNQMLNDRQVIFETSSEIFWKAAESAVYKSPKSANDQNFLLDQREP